MFIYHIFIKQNNNVLPLNLHASGVMLDFIKQQVNSLIFPEQKK